MLKITPSQPGSKVSLWPVVAVLFFYLILGAFYLSHHQWDPTSLVVFGQDNDIANFIAEEQEDLYRYQDPTGYDGQAFYLIAKNPFDFETINEVINSPVWRYQRIFYPFVVYLLSGFGQPVAIPIFLALVNLLAIAGGVYFLIKILEIYKVNSWFSLFYGFYPAFTFTFLYSLAEPLAYFLVLISLYCFLKNKIIKSVIFLILAVLTKETCLFIALGLILFLWLKKKEDYWRKIGWYLLPMVIFVIWYVGLHFIFTDNRALVSSVYINLGLPFLGIARKFMLLPIFDLYIAVVDVFFYLIFFVSVIFIIVNLFRRLNLYNLTATLFASFIFTFASPTLLFPKEYTRHFMGFFLFFLLSYLPTKNKAIPILLAGFLLAHLLYLVDIFVFLNFFR